MRSRAYLLMFCVFSILLLQATGLHLHVANAETASLHAEHVHHADPDGHGYAEDIDVTINEIGASWGKLLVHFLPLLALFALAAVVAGRWVPAVLPAPRIRPSRWRPPLRAPPLPI
jgi:hypothetical protein